jgi:hypothetical protein
VALLAVSYFIIKMGGIVGIGIVGIVGIGIVGIVGIVGIKSESASNPVNCRYFDPTTSQAIVMWEE